MPKLYTVKEAAQIIGVSTNTLYKYLLEGRIKSTRGTARQGRFRIPHSALESFLGVPIPTTTTEPSTSPNPANSVPEAQPTINPNPKPRLSQSSVRILLLIGLLTLIIDLLVNPSWNIINGFLRLIIFACLFMLTYQPYPKS